LAHVGHPGVTADGSIRGTQVGVVAMLLGTATVTRAALPAPAPLRFKDDVLLRDRITTAEKSAVRVLLGGKATVTARERSVLVITEVPGTSTVFLTAGRTAVAVSKAGMKPGESLEIKTPNVVAAVRGTFVGRRGLAERFDDHDPARCRRGHQARSRDREARRTRGQGRRPRASHRDGRRAGSSTPAHHARGGQEPGIGLHLLAEGHSRGERGCVNQEVKKASMSAATDAVNSIAPPAIGTVTGGASTTASVAAPR